MLTAMTEADWTIVLQVFAASRSRRGDKGRDDRKFLEALHYFVVHNITWRALPKQFGHWNSVWKRFWRLSQAGTFEAFFDALAAMLIGTINSVGGWGLRDVLSGETPQLALATKSPPRRPFMPLAIGN